MVTYALIAVNVAMFVLQTASKDLERQLVLWTPAVAYGELYRLLTSAFLHDGVPHLLFNMWALYVSRPAAGKLAWAERDSSLCTC